MRTTSLLVLLLSLVSGLIGCSEPTPSEDAPEPSDVPRDVPMRDDVRADIGVLDVSAPGDVSSDVLGSSDGGADARAPSCVDGGPIDVVVACESAATDMSTRCGSGSDRECEWLAIRELCRSQRAEVLLADMDCTAAFSSDPGGVGCRTFSDPSGARDCIIDANACFEITHATEVAGRLDAAFVTLCGSVGGTSSVHQAAVPLAALSDATLDAIDACVSASDCDGLRTCARAQFSTIFACHP